MRKIVGGAERKNAQRTCSGQSGCVGRSKYLVDRAIAAASHNAVNSLWTDLGNRFGAHPGSVPGFPSDPHLDAVTVLTQRVNSCPQASIIGRLAVQNDADGRHSFSTSSSGA